METKREMQTFFFIASLLIRRIRNFSELQRFWRGCKKRLKAHLHPLSAAFSRYDDAGLKRAGSDSFRPPCIAKDFSEDILNNITLLFLEYASSPFAKITVYEANFEW